MNASPPLASRLVSRNALRPLARALAAGLLAAALPAGATEPSKRLTCTNEPRSAWMGEERARRIFGAQHYALVKFKVSRGNCYEFYAVGRDGGIVEAYYHPVTGQLVRETRFGQERPAAP